MADGASAKQERLVATLVAAPGRFQASEALAPMPGARSAADAPAEYLHLGDLALRFAFAGSRGAGDVPVHESDLARLGLTPTRALALASVHLKRAIRPPEIVTVSSGLYSVRAANRYDQAGRFLDLSFWRAQLARSPAGVWVAMPRHKVLFFADGADAEAVSEIRRLAARSYHSSADGQLSAYLYRFDGEGWHVHEPLGERAAPAAERPAPTARRPPAPSPLAPPAATATAAATTTPLLELSPSENDELLAHAASGQKIVIYAVLLSVLSNVVVRTVAVPPLAASALALAIAIYALFGIVRMCSGLQRSQNRKIVFMVLAFVPLVNIVALVVLSTTTTRALRAAGWSVGLLGAKA